MWIFSQLWEGNCMKLWLIFLVEFWSLWFLRLSNPWSARIWSSRIQHVIFALSHMAAGAAGRAAHWTCVTWRIMWQSFSKLCLPNGFVWKCCVYSQWNSHFIGIMISKTIGFRGTLFSDKPKWLFFFTVGSFKAQVILWAEMSFFEAVWNREIHCMTTVFAMFPTPGQTAANMTNVWLTSRVGAWQLTEWAWWGMVPVYWQTLFGLDPPEYVVALLPRRGSLQLTPWTNMIKHVWAFQFWPGPLNWVLPCRSALSLGAGSTRKNSFWTREEFVLQRCNLSIWFLVEVKHIALPRVSECFWSSSEDSFGFWFSRNHVVSRSHFSDGWMVSTSLSSDPFFSVLCSLEWLGLSQLLVSSRLRILVEFQSQHLRQAWSCSRMDVWTTRKNNTTVAVEGTCLTARAKFCDKYGLTTPLRGIAANLKWWRLHSEALISAFHRLEWQGFKWDSHAHSPYMYLHVLIMYLLCCY